MVIKRGSLAAFTLQSVYPPSLFQVSREPVRVLFFFIPPSLVSAAEGEVVVLAFSSFVSSSNRYL
jgi:hypothetical protein